MALFLIRTATLSVFLAFAGLCIALTPTTAYAQEVSSKEAAQEMLERLLPEPPEGFERSISPAAEGKDHPWAQAMYAFDGKKYQESGGERTQASEKDGENPVVFEVEISRVTEEEKTQLLSQIEGAPPEFEITTEEYEGHPLHVITNTESEKSYLYLFTGPFQVYMEGNAPPTSLRAALSSVDVGTLAQYRHSEFKE
jgi:hypothetical protein